MLSRARIDAARRASTCPASDNGSSVNCIGPMIPGFRARNRDYGEVAEAGKRLEPTTPTAISLSCRATVPPCGPRTRRELAAEAPDPGADRRHAARRQRDARRGRQCVHDRQSGDWRDRAGGRPMLIRLAVGIILWCVAAVALLLVALIFLPLIAIFVEAWLATR